jgi:hypothetical protein
MRSFRFSVLVAFSLISSLAAEAEPLGPRVHTSSSARDLNALVLSLTRSMPTGGSYATTAAANQLLQSAITVSPSGLELEPARAQPSYCSGATYLVFLQVIQQLRERAGLVLDEKVTRALLVAGQADGYGVWGRWNANGPGTARLFHELDLGRNFLSYEEARPGDFMKIFWTKEIGQRERGHSVIYLGTHAENGVEMVRFWSSNQPDGYGEKSVPKAKVAIALFSRLERPANLQRLLTIPARDPYLASLLTVRSSLPELKVKCGL